ncbi:hypothetical protein HDE_12784 [Halotydeus destructor]|nr:hypothetical protein HDE_12784 [Halotydeus destructor]
MMKANRVTDSDRKFQTMAETKMAAGFYEEAIALLTTAIIHSESGYKYDLFRLRSQCYYHVGDYDSAIEDANNAIKLNVYKTDVKMVKARSLMSLRRYKEAEKIFIRVFKSKHSKPECSVSCLEARHMSLLQLGFDNETSKKFAEEHETIDEAIEAAVQSSADGQSGSRITSKISNQEKQVVRNTLIRTRKEPGSKVETKATKGDREMLTISDLTVCVSDLQVEENEFDDAVQGMEEFEMLSLRSCHMPWDKVGFERIKPLNVCQCSAIFVFNLSLDATEPRLRRLFSEFGDVGTIAMHRRCAHVNFYSTESPRDAIFKYHLTPVVGISRPKEVLYVNFCPRTMEEKARSVSWPDKECLYWRTTGCDQRIRICTKNHHPMIRGIDYRPTMDTEIYF